MASNRMGEWRTAPGILISALDGQFGRGTEKEVSLVPPVIKPRFSYRPTRSEVTTDPDRLDE
jgi:hypothetical protein